MAPGQREGGRGRQGAVAAAAAAAAAAVAVVVVVVVIAIVDVAGQHHVPELLLDVVKGSLLHLDAARAVREGERGSAHLEGSRATAARVLLGNGCRRVCIAT